MFNCREFLLLLGLLWKINSDDVIFIIFLMLEISLYPFGK